MDNVRAAAISEIVRANSERIEDIRIAADAALEALAGTGAEDRAECCKERPKGLRGELEQQTVALDRIYDAVSRVFRALNG